MPRRLPGTRQHDHTDCGAACLSSIARYYGLRLPISRIRRLCHTDALGTTVHGLVTAARALGFTARGVRAGRDSLARLPHPSIAHLTLPSGGEHYVVVSKLTRRGVRVMDPAFGRSVALSGDEFRERWTGVLILMAPGNEFRPRDETAGAALRFWSLLRPHRSDLLQALVGAVAYTILGLASAIYVQKIVDHVLVDGNRRLLTLLSLGMIAILLAQAVIATGRGMLGLRTGQKIDASLILRYHRHLLGLPQDFFDSMRVGEIVSRVGDAVKIRGFINDVALDLVVSLLVVLFSLGMMFLFDWRLALGVACCLPLFGAVFELSNRVNRRVLRAAMEQGAELESDLVESVRTISTVKRFSLELQSGLRIERRLVRLLDSVFSAGKVSIGAGVATELVSRGAVVAVLWAGSLLVIDNVLSPGELMSFYALIGYLTAPATQLVTANRTVQEALIASDRLYEILDLETEPSTPNPVRADPDGAGDVRFECVHFRYGSRPAVLAGLDLHIPGGEVTAIVGASGSGKSTLMALAQGLYPITEGRITLDGVPLSLFDADQLRRLITAVPQEIHLFSGNLLENIAPGERHPDMRRVLEVCDSLRITGFIEALPHGFHTRIGENGVDLSGGQRQRLAIARAIYRRPRVLFLDEATSNLDLESEACVRDVLTELRRSGTTIVLIAHRLSALSLADRIVVLEEGTITAAGTHQELMNGDGFYPRMWRAQQAASLHPVAIM